MRVCGECYPALYTSWTIFLHNLLHRANQRSSAPVHGLGYYLASGYYLIKGRKVGSLDCGVSFLLYLEAAQSDTETRQRTVSFQP